MLDKNQIIRKIEANRKDIKAFGVERIILIGSYVQGTAKNKSDIDFLVQFRKGRGLFDDYIHLRQFLQDLFRKEIDIGEEKLIREELRESILGGKRPEAKI